MQASKIMDAEMRRGIEFQRFQQVVLCIVRPLRGFVRVSAAN
jgi:hypothetical protein